MSWKLFAELAENFFKTFLFGFWVTEDVATPVTAGDQLLKKDMKLRSKVSVDVYKLKGSATPAVSPPPVQSAKPATRKSARQSAAAATSANTSLDSSKSE